MLQALKALQKNKEVNIKQAKVDLSGEVQTLPHISTGSVILDYLIGGDRTPSGNKRCPGIPKGRITEIFGSEGTGKCFLPDTSVQTEFGMLTIEELFKKLGKTLDDVEKIEECEVKLLNENGELESTSHLTWNGRQTVRHITTQRGLKIGVTENHPMRVMGDDGYITWKNAGDIQVGDHMVMLAKGYFPETSKLNKSEAELLGYLIADGSYTQGHRIHFSNSDPCIIQDYTRVMTDVFGTQNIRVYERKDSNGVDHHINSKELHEKLMTTYGLEPVTAPYREVPQCVREGTREVQEAFLRAFIELECHIDSRRRCIEVVSSSYKLMEQVQLMLLSMGYISTLSEKKVKNYPDNQYWRLTWGGEYAVRYAAEIGFISKARQATIAEFSDAPFNSNVDGIPNLGSVLKELYQTMNNRSREDYKVFGDYMSGKASPSRERLARILTASQGRGDRTTEELRRHLQSFLDQGYFFTKVVDIEIEHDVPTFDVCLPETHSFWSNGLISHNTTVAIHTAINVLDNGGSVCFLDYEHAFSPIYANDLGLDITNPNFILLQPRHFEEGAEIINAMAESGVDLIIVDSVAAMVSKKLVESGDMGSTGQIGVIPRLLSSFLPRMVGTLAETGSSLVFINQLRSRIKTSQFDYGPDEDTTGGKAMKFYASLRLEVRRVKTEYAEIVNNLTDAKEKQAITNIVRARNIKNKVSSHQGHTAEFAIRYGQGIDNVRSIIDVAESRKIVVRGGAWYSFAGPDGEEKKVQGKEGLRDYLIANPDTFQYLVQQVANRLLPDAPTFSVSDEDIEEEYVDEETDF